MPLSREELFREWYRVLGSFGRCSDPCKYLDDFEKCAGTPLHLHPAFGQIALECTRFENGNAIRRIIETAEAADVPFDANFLAELLVESVQRLSPGAVNALLEAGAPVDTRVNGLDLIQFATATGKYDDDRKANMVQIKKDIAAFKKKPLAERKRTRAPKRVAIPQAERAKLWDRFYGPTDSTPVCICCRASRLKFDAHGFEAAHIIARTHCNHDELWNLLPVCGQCNNVNRTENLFDWFVREWPERLLELAERVARVNEPGTSALVFIEAKFHTGVPAGGISNATLAMMRAEERHEKRYRELEKRVDALDGLDERVAALEDLFFKKKQKK